MSEIRFVLAVDGGGTKTEAALLTPAGEELARVRAGACNLYQDAAAGLAAIASAWSECCRVAGVDPAAAVPGACLSAGLAGVGARGAAARFHTAFPGFARRYLSSDGYIALVGALEAAPGALLSIGTGVVGYRLRADGDCRQLGGWGFPAGDRGGGAWLGLRLVGDWLDGRDGHGPATAATRPLRQAVGDLLGDDRGAILDWLRAARPGDFARLARPLVEAAAAGDAYAGALLDEAAGHLARLALALGPTREEPLVLSGGLAPIFAGRLETSIGADRLARDRAPSPLRGAWLIGIGRAAPEFPEPGQA